MTSSVFQNHVSVDQVKKLVDFGGKTTGYESLVELQARGTTALFNRLCAKQRRFAYLADEVGMGKTYQALGVASLVWALKPDARVVFVSTRANLQEKWERDFKNFYRENYLQRAGVGRSRVEGQPSVTWCRPENLRDFAVELRLPGRLGFFLRMTSFRRPVAVFESRDAWDVSREKAHAMMNRVGLAGELAREAKKHGRASASAVLNEVFADAMRQLLVQIGDEDKRPAVDLLVIDEAQSLRNPDNQTNKVFRKIFGEGSNGEARVVDRWLFLSATPVHGSRDDIVNAVKVANPGYRKLDGDPTEGRFKAALKEFMVRRPRTYRTNGSGNGSAILTKVDYRDHRVDDEEWLVRSMSAEAALAMALVQKKLVQVLANQANRFKVGYLSSFESLHSSLRRKLGNHEADDEEQGGEHSDHEHLESDGAKGDEPPDAGFVQRLGEDYFARFGRTLPHAKLDRVVDVVANRAWERGDKVLIFARRINTVEELAQRLEETHEDAVVSRIRQFWSRELDWKDGLSGLGDQTQDASAEPLPDGDDAERSPGAAVDAVVRTRRPYGLRSAFREDQWLERYRNTYRSTGRNALVFHENWFRTLCRLGGVAPKEAVERVPDDLWRASYQAAAKRSGGSVRVDPVVRSHHLVLQLLQQQPSVFGGVESSAAHWRDFLGRIYPSADTKGGASAATSTGGGRDERLLLYEGFWEQWFARGDEALNELLAGDQEQLATRQCAMSWIGQSLRLTDALIDLRCAEAKDGETSGPYRFEWLRHFFDYLHGDHPHAKALLGRCRAWASHADVIIRNCFEIQGSRLELAEKGAYDELNVATPVVRVVGGSPQPRAIRQFKMPYYPMVVVCTDVLKEGEDLHVFCDKVVHYGVAWTSGDLEQRVGRVDRFFSQIERRVRDDPDSKLPVYYPHVFGSIERRQVSTVLHRVRTAERLMGDIGVKRSESREIDASAPASGAGKELAAVVVEHPFDVRDEDLPASMQGVAGHGEDDHRSEAGLLQSLVDWALKRMAPGQVAALAPERLAGEGLADLRWTLSEGQRIDLLWDFIPELRCYALTARQNAEDGDSEVFGCYVETVSEARTYRARLDRLIFPREAGEGSDAKALRTFLAYVRTPTVKPTESEQRVRDVVETLRSVPGVRERTIRTEGHRVEATFDALPGRQQKLKAYVYDEMVLLSSVACRVTKALQTRFGEGTKGEAELTKWVAKHNAQLRAGYVHHHRPGENEAQLCFCERVFHDLTPSKTWTSLVRDVVLYADGLEVLLAGGEDVE